MDPIQNVRYLDGGKERAKIITRGGQVQIKFKNKNEFNGQVMPEQGMIRMVGTMTYKKSNKTNQKHIYQGDLFDCKRQGQGTYTIPPVRVYEGRWENDVLVQGKLTEVDGRVFEGTFTADDNRDPLQNEGVETLNDGTRFEGRFLNDKRHGEGLLTTTQGIRYAGNFVNGVLESATVTFPNGDEFNGTFTTEGKFLRGRYHFASSGGEYEGEFLNNTRHGQGTFWYPQGAVYVGTWEHGLKKEGTMTYPDGKKYIGSYHNENGESRKEKGQLISPSGAIYNGTFKNGTMDGKGLFTYPSGDFFDGFWKDGFKNGEGKYTHANGDVYTGTWKNDAREGTGKHVRNYKVEFNMGKIMNEETAPYMDERGEETEIPEAIEIMTTSLVATPVHPQEVQPRTGTLTSRAFFDTKML